jgi:dihydrofolate synthase/folylpolyglutamate synthase
VSDQQSIRHRLLALEQFGVKLGLDNIRALVEALGRPDRAYPCVLIAGTNGKGSVAAIVERALRATGRRTGRYTSPHLVSLTERVAIDGAPIDDATFDAITAQVLDVEAACRADARLHAHATFFEVTTAIALEAFRRAAVDVAVLEVGLGGRFDATNVVAPIATAIVSIDLDHTKQLGSTRAAIATEKAGIARAGVPLVVGEMAAEPLAVIEDIGALAGAPVIHAAEGIELELTSEPIEGRAEVRLTTATRSYGPVRLGLAGAHQLANAIVAVRLLEEIDTQGLAVDQAAIETGLSSPVWRGRLEHLVLADGREVLLDAAHNAAGARALAVHVSERWPDRPTLLFACAADKDAAWMIAALAPVVGNIVLTSFANARSARPADLEAAVHAAGLPNRLHVVEPATAGLDRALASARHVVVAGSIFLLGELLPEIDRRRSTS